ALASSCSFGGGVVQGYGNQSGRFGGTFFGEGSGDMYVQRFAVDLSNSMPFNAVVGRIGSQTANPYVFKRKDNSPYFDNSRWDDGNWTVDGALVSFKVGQGSLSILGGRNNDRLTNNGVELQPVLNDSSTLVQDTLGAEAKFNLGANANLSAAYFMHFLTGNGTSATGGADRLEVFGAGLNYNLGGGLTAGVNYASSALKNQGSTVADDNNTALAVELGYGTDKWGLVGGYHRIDRDFMSAGSWYRIGTNYSPMNVEDWMVKGWFKLGTNGKITASYMDGENVRSAESASPTAAINNFEYTSFKADLDYTVWGNWNLLLGYESVDLDGSRTPFLSTTTNYSIEQKWTSLGLSYNMSSNSMFKVLYQYGDVKNGRAWGAGPSGNYKGHILTSQISIKF
ncbi:MAG: hypothetical protein J0L72_12140, partial [Armatimonadetes bacterium]|nr:hypothetical protein [Armatimonadota bacterium]